MAVGRKGKHKITVDGQLYLWTVRDAIEGEGHWTLHVTDDHNWQWQLEYPLSEIELQSLAKSSPLSPLPESFDQQSMKLKDAATTDLGFDRHFRPTPGFVRQLILWYLSKESSD